MNFRILRLSNRDEIVWNISFAFVKTPTMGKRRTTHISQPSTRPIKKRRTNNGLQISIPEAPPPSSASESITHTESETLADAFSTNVDAENSGQNFGGRLILVPISFLKILIGEQDSIDQDTDPNMENMFGPGLDISSSQESTWDPSSPLPEPDENDSYVETWQEFFYDHFGLRNPSSRIEEPDMDMTRIMFTVPVTMRSFEHHELNLAETLW